MAIGAATDFAAFYDHTAPMMSDAGMLLVISVDGKGTVMRPADLREATSKKAEPPTGASADRQAADPRPSTPNATNSATPWNAESTGSRATAPSRPDTKNSPAATRPPSPLQPSTAGYDRLPGQSLDGPSRAVSSFRVMNH